MGTRKTGLSPPVFYIDRFKAVLLLWFLTVTCSCCPYLYFGSTIMLVTYFVNFRWLNDHLFGKELFIRFTPRPPPPPPQYFIFHTDRSKTVLLLWFLTVACSCFPYLYFGSVSTLPSIYVFSYFPLVLRVGCVIIDVTNCHVKTNSHVSRLPSILKSVHEIQLYGFNFLKCITSGVQSSAYLRHKYTLQ